MQRNAALHVVDLAADVHLAMAAQRLDAVASTLAAVAMNEDPAARVLDTGLVLGVLGVVDRVLLDLRLFNVSLVIADAGSGSPA